MQSSEQTNPTTDGDLVEIVLEEYNHSVVPGGSATIPVVLINRGTKEDFFRLSVEGLPSAWITIPSPVIQIGPGVQTEVQLTIKPPRSPRSTAGRQLLTVQVVSQRSRDPIAKTEIALTITAFTEFNAELLPQRIAAGRRVEVSILNRSNVPSILPVETTSTDSSSDVPIMNSCPKFGKSLLSFFCTHTSSTIYMKLGSQTHHY